MSPCFHRLGRCTAALGALDATIRSGIPMRPLCPLNQTPRPAGRAVARTRVGKGLADETEHRSLGINAGEPNLSQVPDGGRGHCHRCRFHLVLSPCIVSRPVPSAHSSTSPQVRAAGSERLSPPSAWTPMLARSRAARLRAVSSDSNAARGRALAAGAPP